jgi:hypothetical protein
MGSEKMGMRVRWIECEEREIDRWRDTLTLLSVK